MPLNLQLEASNPVKALKVTWAGTKMFFIAWSRRKWTSGLRKTEETDYIIKNLFLDLKLMPTLTLNSQHFTGWHSFLIIGTIGITQIGHQSCDEDA